MKRFLQFFRSLFSECGIDKYAHLGIGGLICAMFTIAFIICEFEMVTWMMALYFIPGLLVVVMISIFKEFIDSTGFDWKDIIWAIMGCLMVELSVLFGLIIYFLGQ